MKFLDYYLLDFKFNNKPFEFNPLELSFSLFDSIYSFYNSATLQVNDMSGLLQEYLSFNNGTKVSISLGTDDHTNECTYVINQNRLDKPNIMGLISGMVDLNLVNHISYEQTPKSVAYKDSISKIISKIMNTYKLNGFDIESTTTPDIWYQALMTDAKFIRDILNENAYVSNANAPFYSYITNDNVFHFKNIQSMLNNKPVITLEYTANVKDVDQKTLVFGLKRWSENLDNNRQFYNRTNYYINRETGNIDTKISKINDTANGKKTNLLNVEDLTTSFHNVYFYDPNSAQRDNLNGRIYDSTRQSIFTDHLLLLHPFQPTLHSGQKIILNIYIKSDKDFQLSKHYSGEYIIENCEHIFYGTENKVFTKLIVGRKYITINSAYLLSTNLL